MFYVEKILAYHPEDGDFEVIYLCMNVEAAGFVPHVSDMASVHRTFTLVLEDDLHRHCSMNFNFIL